MSAMLSFRKIRRFVLPLCGAVLALALALSALARQSPQELRKEAQDDWDAKLYPSAAEIYRNLLVAEPKTPDRPEFELRILAGDIKAAEWDTAIAEAESYVKRYANTRYEAQGQVWRGRLYVLVPHDGYTVGKKAFRGEGVPKSEGGLAPVEANFEANDAKLNAAAWKRAKELFERFRREKRSNDADLDAEIQMNFDLAHNAEEDYAPDNPANALYTDWAIDLKQPFDRHAPPAKQAVYLYEQIPVLDALRPHSDGHNVVLAALGKAAFVLKIREAGMYPQYQGSRIGRESLSDYAHWITPPPYVALDPIQILQDVLAKYPHDTEADRLAFTIAAWTESKGDLLEALRLFNLLLTKYPDSFYVSDANSHIQAITRPTLNLTSNGVNLPGRRAQFSVSGRNVKQVRFTAYKITLEDVYGKMDYREILPGPVFRPPFSDFRRNFGRFHFGNPRTAFLEPLDDKGSKKFAEWTLQTSDTRRHNPFADTVKTPLDVAGAYLIEAVSGENNEIKTSTVVIVSDLAIVQKVDRDSVLVYAANAVTGRPVADVKLVVWSPIHNHTIPGISNENQEAQYLNGVTGADGQCRLKLPMPVDVAVPALNATRNAETFAIGTANRYAVTEQSEFNSYELSNTEPYRKGWIQLDRPLYRPAQAVKYRAILTEGLPGAYRLVAGAKVTIHINGPHGVIQKSDATLDANGSYSGNYGLASNADLGDYSVVMRANESQVYETHFRVEEYKKPEYTVSIQPEKSQVRTGETVKANITAQYYFGAPVMRAKVHYRVVRSYHQSARPFPPRVDWYEDAGDSADNNNERYNPEERTYYQLYRGENEVVAEGDAVTDAAGQAQITFSTKPPKPLKGFPFPPNYRPDENFVITADVTDDSRRQVSAVGAVTAIAAEFHAYLRLDRNFVTMGDNLQIELRTKDGGDKPVSAGGFVHIIRLIPAVPERKIKDPNTGKWKIVQRYVPLREEPDGSLFIQTDAPKEGIGLAFWNPDKTGDFRLDYLAKDKYGNAVTASQAITVYGQDYDSRLKKGDKRFSLTPEKALYAPGETARVLVVAPIPNSYVLLTVAATGSMRQTRTVFIAGRSAIVNVPVTPDMIPNVSLDANVLYQGVSQAAKAAFGVPAQERILTLNVIPDKAQYKPGETATFKIIAKDASGKPVKGHFSLAVVDKSLLAIQPDLTPDIRAQFYGFQIQTAVGGVDSVSYNAGQATISPPEISYMSHSLLYPEGMGYLRDFISQNEALPGYVVYNPTSPGAWNVAKDGKVQFTAGLRLSAAQRRQMQSSTGGSGGRDRFGRVADYEDGTSAVLYAPMSPADSGEHWSIYRKAPARLMPSIQSAADAAGAAGPQGPPGEIPLVEAVVRQKFLDTAFWTPSINTDGDGEGVVSFPFPDNITDWDVKTAGYTNDVKVGLASASAVVKKNLLDRLQAPRFFVERDTVVVSANIHNYLSTEKSVHVRLVVDNNQLTFANSAKRTPPKPRRELLPDELKDEPLTNFEGENDAISRDPPGTQVVTIKPNDEVRLDWTLQINHAGPTKIKVMAQTNEESDAAEMTFPVLVHGVEKFLAESGVIRNDGTQTVTLDIPAQRRKGATRLDVQLQPSLAATVIDALPYLEDYPYGCLEQTLSRFVPTVLTAKALQNAGINLEDLGKRAAVLEEQRANIPPQQVYENSGYTYPKGVPGVLQTAELASRLNYPTGRRSHAPIFDSAVLKQMTTEGLQRLELLQKPSGGFGWWEGSAAEDEYMSAYAADSLIKLRNMGAPVNEGMFKKLYTYLNARVDTQEDLNLRAYYCCVLASCDGQKRPAQDFLYERRDRLTPYGQALLVIALHHAFKFDKAEILLRSLIDTAKIDKEHGSAHWESKDAQYWQWYNDKQETTAMILRAFEDYHYFTPDNIITTRPIKDPNRELEAKIVKWLVDNRQGSVWTSTRQTANVVEALLEYASFEGELAPSYDATVDVDGKVARTFHISKENALFFDNRFLVGDEILGDGPQQLHITLKGAGTLYYSSYLSYFDLQEPIKGVSNAIGVERKYYKITPKVTQNKNKEYVTTNDRALLTDGANLVSGDIIEVELYIKSDNDYDYLVFEDMKPAGCEAVETRSGAAYGDGLCSNFELRDTKVAFFIDHLKQGTSRITYKLRAEIPGSFHALPTNAYAFYTPDIRALSDEWRVTIADAPTIQLPSDKTQKRMRKR